jgi:hypothetical protein
VGRWRSEAGVIPRAAVEPMDDWLLAFFGHLRGRLARLPAGGNRHLEWIGRSSPPAVPGAGGLMAGASVDGSQ